MSPRLVWMVAFAVAEAVIGSFFHGGSTRTRAEKTVPRSVKSTVNPPER
jgi:hypothetical protein